MSTPDEVRGVPENPEGAESRMPRLFGEAEDVNAQGWGGGEEGLGEAEARRADDPTLRGRDPSDRSLQELVAAYRQTITRGRSRRPEAEDSSRRSFTAEQRLLILDTWLKSRLPGGDFAALLGLSKHTLYVWKQRFERSGPAGLDDHPRGRREGSRLPDVTQRAILMLKEAHPDWGQDRISAELMRSAGFQASPGAVGRVLEEAGYTVVARPTVAHEPPPHRFERAKPNQLWQTDLFTFVLKREARRVHLVAFLDDHSRFIVGYGLHASASGALVREVLEAAIANHGAPQEVLTDNGTQYHTWRGKSEFTRLLERRGIQQIVARPRHPETLGKIERFWGTLWRECVQSAIFRGLDDARRRIGLFIDHYNFQRPHSGIEQMVPADRFFVAAPQGLATLKQRVAANAVELARDGLPRKAFYLTGRVGDQSISLHAEGERVVLTKGDGSREEVDLGATGPRQQDAAEELPQPLAAEGRPPDHPGTLAEPELPPGESALDEDLPDLLQGLEDPA